MAIDYETRRRIARNFEAIEELRNFLIEKGGEVHGDGVTLEIDHYNEEIDFEYTMYYTLWDENCSFTATIFFDENDVEVWEEEEIYPEVTTENLESILKIIK